MTERETDSILKLQLSSVNTKTEHATDAFSPLRLLGVVNRSCYVDLSGRRGYSTIVNSPFECTRTHTHTHTHTLLSELCVYVFVRDGEHIFLCNVCIVNVRLSV